MTDSPTQHHHRRLIRASRARAEMLGGVSAMTTWRWLNAYPDMPRPFKIGNQNFFDVDELELWIEKFRMSAPEAIEEAESA